MGTEGVGDGPRVLHVCVAYASHEGMARTATELALRLPGLHHGLCTDRLRTPAPAFATAGEV
ncbi:MAG TPA: hypothetical protein VFO65_01795 [Acidimicrobiales bacterium]|nr:hypothetical protein [Acidimicrobiales bacterium]